MSLPSGGGGGAKGGMGNAELMGLLSNLPNVNFNPAQVAPAGPAPDFNAQLSNFYGDDPMKITQPYQDYYKSMPLPGDESKPAPAPAPTPPVVTPPVIRDETAVRNQGQNMNFNNPMVGTVEMPDIAPGAFRYGGGMMEDFGMVGREPTIRPTANQNKGFFGFRPSTSPEDQQRTRDMAGQVFFGNTSVGPNQQLASSSMLKNRERPVARGLFGGMGAGGGIIEDFVPSMPILDAAPKPKGRVATRKKKKRTVKRGGRRRLS